MPLVFIALVVAMLIASHRDNKKQEKRIRANEEARRRANEESLREKGISTALTCARDEMRIAQVLVRKGVSIDDAIKVARAEISARGYTPCVPDEDFKAFNYDNIIPDDYIGGYDGASRRESLERDRVNREEKELLEERAKRMLGKNVYVPDEGYGKVVEAYIKEEMQPLGIHELAQVGNGTFVRSYRFSHAVFCKIELLDGRIVEAKSEKLTEIN